MRRPAGDVASNAPGFGPKTEVLGPVSLAGRLFDAVAEPLVGVGGRSEPDAADWVEDHDVALESGRVLLQGRPQKLGAVKQRSAGHSEAT